MKTVIMMLALVVVASASAQEGSGTLVSVERRNVLELQDGQGQVVFWIDGFRRVHSPDLIAWQQEYNSFIRSSFRTFIGPGLSAREGIILLAPQPPGRRGIRPGGSFAVPYDVAENGVLTRDTLSIPFFELGVRWNYLAQFLDSDCAEAKRTVAGLNCAPYHSDWSASTSDQRRSPDDDPLLFGVRAVELQKALGALRRLQQLLDGVVTVTVNGERSDEARDREMYDERNNQCLRLSFFNTCVLNADSVMYPFDWMTAQVVSTQLPPEFLDKLHQAEEDAQASISSSEHLRELSQLAVIRNGR